MAKEEWNENMRRTYKMKNRGLEIKADVMEILYSRFKELNSELDSFTMPQGPDTRNETLRIMAEIGKAILPD